MYMQEVSGQHYEPIWKVSTHSPTDLKGSKAIPGSAPHPSMSRHAVPLLLPAALVGGTPKVESRAHLRIQRSRAP